MWDTLQFLLLKVKFICRLWVQSILQYFLQKYRNLFLFVLFFQIIRLNIKLVSDGINLIFIKFSIFMHLILTHFASKLFRRKKISLQPVVHIYTNIISILQVLDEVSVDGIVSYIKSGKCKNIITLAGAGISTSAGIYLFFNLSYFLLDMNWVYYYHGNKIVERKVNPQTSPSIPLSANSSYPKKFQYSAS